MTVKPKPEARLRRATARTKGETSPSFEALLEQVLADVAAGGATGTQVQTALDRIAEHFSVDRVVVRLAGDEAANCDASRQGDGSKLEISLGEGGQEALGTAALCTHDPGRTWSKLDLDRLRLVAGIVVNVLRLRSVQDELRENQVWLFMALESATIGTWDWDVTTDRVRYIAPFNRAASELEVRETVGGSWYQATHPDDIPVARAAVERAISGESDSFSFVVRSKRPPYRGGEWFQLHSRGRVVDRDATGRATRIMGVHEDVTEATRKAELERQKEAALAHATRMASLGALASSLAHEINQPLAALTSFLEASVRLLERGDSSREEVAAALKRSIALAEKASEIVRRLRRLLRRERPLQEPIELPAALHVVRDQLARETRAAGVEVKIVEPPEPITIRGDRVQIEQAVVNLVRNAVEALAGTDREPRVVTLEAIPNGHTVELRVSDNGPGVAEADAARVFDPFFTTKSGGTGLGLVICESIAEIHGGRVRLVHSGPDGTTFTLELPAMTEDGQS